MKRVSAIQLVERGKRLKKLLAASIACGMAAAAAGAVALVAMSID